MLEKLEIVVGMTFGSRCLTRVLIRLSQFSRGLPSCAKSIDRIPLYEKVVSNNEHL